MTSSTSSKGKEIDEEEQSKVEMALIETQNRNLNRHSNSSSDSDSDDQDIASLLARARQLQDLGPKKGNDDELSLRRLFEQSSKSTNETDNEQDSDETSRKDQKEGLAKLRSKMTKRLGSKLKGSGTSRGDSIEELDDLLSKLQEVPGTSHDEMTKGLGDILTKLREKMAKDLASKRKVIGTSHDDSIGGLDDLLAKLQEVPGTSREDPTKGLADMLVMLRKKMIDDLDSKVKSLGTNDEDPTEGLKDMLAKLRAKMDEDLASKVKTLGSRREESNEGLDELLAKLQAVSGDVHEDSMEGLGNMLTKLREKMVQDMASKLKLLDASSEDPTNELGDMLTKLRAKMVEDLASMVKGLGIVPCERTFGKDLMQQINDMFAWLQDLLDTSDEDRTDGLGDMLAKLRAKMVEDLASTVKGLDTSNDHPIEGLGDMLAKLRAKMVEDLSSTVKDLDTSSEDSTEDLGDMLAKLRAKMVEDLASKVKGLGSSRENKMEGIDELLAKLQDVPGTHREDPTKELKDMLTNLREKMVEDLTSKLKLLDTSNENSTEGLGDMLATLRAKMVEDLASTVKDLDTSNEDPTKESGDLLAKLRGKMVEDLTSTVEGLGNSGTAGLEGLLKDLAETQAKMRISKMAELMTLLEKFSKLQTMRGRGSKDYSQYLPLYRATLAGDWETTRQFIENNREAVTASVNHSSETALYIAVEAGSSHVHFVRNLVDIMSAKDLEVQNDIGNTALSVAAIVGNVPAARILVRKNPRLLYIPNRLKYLPVHEAGQWARKNTLVYLRQVTNANTEPGPYDGDTGFSHLVDVMIAEFYDVALDIVKEYPQLATHEVLGFDAPLTVMSKKPLAFPSGTHLSFWERLIYSVLEVKLESPYGHPNNGDIETASSHHPASRMQACACNCLRDVYKRLRFMLSEVLGFLVPHIKDTKLVHVQALQLVRNLCKAIRLSNRSATHIRCTLNPIIEAAINGVPEVIEEIIDAMPIALWSTRKDHYIFQLAVVNRCEKVFNLIYQMREHKQHILMRRDDSGNNILHLAGYLAPAHKLNLVSGAALQMQREIQWYKEVEKFVTHAQRLKVNSKEKTPAMVFSEEHKELAVAGEKWMKDIATSDTIAAALIVTMVFSAAISVPGGIDQETGHPIFSERSAFKLFFISDAISLFTSTTSLLMFLSILTARYAEQDFLFTLPNRLIIGLVTLFVSTTSMMIAFSSTLYLVFGNENSWSLIPIVGLACLPVTVFVTLQFPLLVDVISSTYGRGIFGKQSKRRLY